MIHWFVALGAGLLGLAIGMAVGYCLTYKVAEAAAKVGSVISETRPHI